MLDRIRQRLTMSYVGILALILVLFGAIVVFSFARQVAAQQDTLLAQKAEAEANSLLRDGETYGGIRANAESDIAMVAVPPDGSIDVNFLDLGSSGSSLGLPFMELAQKASQEERTVAETVDGSEGPVRVVSMPLYDDSGEELAVVQAAQLRRVVRESVSNLILILVPVGLGALLVAGVGGLHVSRRAMRPVRNAFDRQRAFIADASHELKTPLTLIKTNAELLQRGLADPEDSKEITEDLLSEVDLMNAVLSDLLVLARLDAGKLAVSREPFELAKVLAKTAERFGTRAAAQGIRLKIEAPGELPALGDPEQTGQVLAVLLDNAMRFTPSGGCVTVVGHSDDGRVEASVVDTGPGIAAEHLPHIFDRFYRVQTARTRASGGTGLGLTIARGLARAQGGELVADNVPSGGASFTLRLPAGT
jgi:signal transduction histidine kinase